MDRFAAKFPSEYTGPDAAQVAKLDGARSALIPPPLHLLVSDIMFKVLHATEASWGCCNDKPLVFVEFCQCDPSLICFFPPGFFFSQVLFWQISDIHHRDSPILHACMPDLSDTPDGVEEKKKVFSFWCIGYLISPFRSRAS